MPDLVPRKDLPSAISLNGTVYQGGALLGPALAGFLLPFLSFGGIFLINAASFMIVLAAIALMRDVPQSQSQGSRANRENIFAGFRYVSANRFVAILLVLSTLTGVFGRSYVTLMPVFAGAVWNAGVQGLGLLLSASGAGALVGAFGMAAFGDVAWRGRLLFGALLVFCLAVGMLAMLPAGVLPVAILLVFVSSVSSTVIGTLIATLIQLSVPGQLRGRVMSLYTITIIGMPSLGALGIAAIADRYGAPFAVAGGAAVLLGIIVVLTPWMLQIRTAPQPVEEAAQP